MFPIHTDTSCRLKWSWSTIYLNAGTTGSCHRSSISDIPENFSEFHNTQKKLQSRKLMLEGAWPGDGCEYCRNIELAGGASDRQFQNTIPGIYPDELDIDPTLVNVDPVILEIFWANTCNQKCVYCNAKNSSAIQAENEKFGGAILQEEDFKYQDNKYEEFSEKFWEWFKLNSTKIKRLQILGGEPFLLRDMDRLVEYFRTVKHPNLEFNIVTNLSLPQQVIQSKLKFFADLIKDKCVKRIDIQTSIDSWGASHEYIRYGSNINTFESNMQFLISQRIFRIGLLSTITSLSIPSMIELFNQREAWRKKQEIFWYMHLVLPNDTSIFSPVHFEYSVWEPHLNLIQNSLSELTWDDKETKKIFVGIMQKLKAQCKSNRSMQKRLLEYLNENDRRRNTVWRETFPWLEQELKYVV